MQYGRAIRLEITNRAANVISKTATTVVSDADDITIIDTEIQDIPVSFEYTKNQDQSEDKDVGSVTIQGISAETAKKFGFRFARVKLFVKYIGTGLPYQLLFEADVTGVEFKKEGGTQCTLQLIGNIVRTTLANKVKLTFPENSDFVRVVAGLAKACGLIGFSAPFGKDQSFLQLERVNYPFGYSATGTPQEVLDAFFRSYNLAWRVEGNLLVFSPYFVGSLLVKDFNVVSLSEDTGLIGLPYIKTQDYTKSVDEAVEENEIDLGVKVTTKKDGTKKESKKRRVRKVGVEVKALINPAVFPDSVIQVTTSTSTPDGLYRVKSVKFTGETHGSAWYMDISGEDVGREY